MKSAATHPSCSTSTPAANRAPLWVLAAVCLAAVILPLSFTGGAIASSAIGRDLGGSPLALNWITNAFMLSFGSLLMTAGAMADAFGRKRVFAGGVTAFVVTSVVIAFAPDIAMVDVARALQGIAAAAALAGGSAALAQEFDGAARTRAFSLLGTSFGVGLAFGPIIAGLLIAYSGWRSVFLSSALIGVLALLFGVPKMHESRDPGAAHFDLPGAVSFTCMLGLFTWGVLQLPASGWWSATAWSLLGGAALALACFIRIERRARQPMLDLSLFSYPRFIGVQMLPVATCYCYVVLLVLLPAQLVGIRGQGEVSAGLTMISLSLPLLLMPSIAAALTRWVSVGRICGLGLIVAAIGLFWLGTIDAADIHASIAAPLALIGIGTGLPWGLMDGLAVSVVPKERAGMATGIFSTTRVAGEGVAIAMVTALLALLVQGQLAGPVHESGAVQLLAMGNVKAAASQLPGLGMDVLLGAYSRAFHLLLYVLTGITVSTGVAVLWLLGDARKTMQD